MLQPRTYPKMLGKALVFEADPFVVMVDDDDPWQEGLFMIVLVGLLIGLAQLIGGLLLSASLPSSTAVREALFRAWHIAGVDLPPEIIAGGDTLIHNAYHWFGLLTGYGVGWERLFVLIWIPLALIIQWLIFSVIGHFVARGMGGSGALNQTLGATALIVAPQVLLLLRVVPFVSVSGMLLFVWSLLIAYRALEIAHELPWKQAMWAALIPALVIAVLTAGFGMLLGASAIFWGV